MLNEHLNNVSLQSREPLDPSLEKLIDRAESDINTKVGEKGHTDVMLDIFCKLVHDLYDELIVSSTNGQEVTAAQSWRNQIIGKTSLYLKLQAKEPG